MFVLLVFANIELSTGHCSKARVQHGPGNIHPGCLLLRVSPVLYIVNQQAHQSTRRNAPNDSNINTIQPRKRRVKSRLGHLRNQRVGRVELLVDSPEDLGLPFLVAREGHRASLRDARGGLDGVDDAAEVGVLQVERLDRLRGDGDAALEEGVGDAVGGDVDAGFGQDGVDAEDAGLQDVERFPVEPFVVADWVQLGDGGERGPVVEGR